MATFQLFFQSGRAKELSALLYNYVRKTRNSETTTDSPKKKVSNRNYKEYFSVVEISVFISPVTIIIFNLCYFYAKHITD